MTTDCDGLGAPEILARIPGLTYRRLDYWTRTGRRSPHTHERDGDTGSGIPFCWPLDQVQAAARMSRLTSVGFNLDVAARLAHSPGPLFEQLLEDIARIERGAA